MCGLSLVAASGGYSSLQCTGFPLQWLLVFRSTGSRHTGLSSCSMRAQQLWLVGSRVQAQQLWLMGLAAPRHVGSSWTRAQTCVSCIGRRITNHCATREALLFFLIFNFFFFCCATQLAESQFTDEGLNLGPGSESTESQPLVCKGIPHYL